MSVPNERNVQDAPVRLERFVRAGFLVVRGGTYRMMGSGRRDPQFLAPSIVAAKTGCGLT